jgi:hypothetical protein
MRGRRRGVALLLACALLTACGLRAARAEEAAPAKPDPFAPVRFLAGEWRGTASGEPGEAVVERSYAFVLQGRFLRERNLSRYAPSAANPAGEVHEHESFFSYDRARERIVLRQFHQEGFVNTYTLDPAASGAAKLVFVSEGFENFDDAWRARETYELISPEEFVETFELAPPGKPFAVYSRTRLKRSSSPQEGHLGSDPN